MQLTADEQSLRSPRQHGRSTMLLINLGAHAMISERFENITSTAGTVS